MNVTYLVRVDVSHDFRDRVIHKVGTSRDMLWDFNLVGSLTKLKCITSAIFLSLASLKIASKKSEAAAKMTLWHL